MGIVFASHDAMTTTNPRALVTGAAQGIGRGLTRRLLAEGYEVWGLDVDADALDDCANYLPAPDAARFHARRADVADEAEVAAAIAAIAEHGKRLDLLVNNAGISGPFNGPVESLALADWQRVIDVNLTGGFLMAKHAVPLLRAAGGSIINIASSRALQSEAHTEAYAASKGGVAALTHALAISLGPNIRVNAVAPGWIDVRDEQAAAQTPAPLRGIDHGQHPAGRVGRGEDIAGLVAFLASADAAFITGQMMVADGGMTRKMVYEH